MNNALPSYTQVSAPRRKASFSIPRLTIHDTRRRTSSFVSSQGNYKDFLLQRGRITNLGVLLLATTAILSLLINLRLYYDDIFRNPHQQSLLINSIKATLPLPHTPSLEHLVIVPGHGIWQGFSDGSSSSQDEDWLLQPFQAGDAKTLVKHIQEGVSIAASDPTAFLVYSGGQTSLLSSLTESISYARLATALNLYERSEAGAVLEVGRVTTENYALDSLENLLFSTSRFKEITGRYPSQITVVGFEFKRTRFETVHRESIKFPIEKFTYIGVDNEGDVEADYAGEKLKGLEPFTRDRYGCHSELVAKRKKRNPFRRYHPYHTSAPELVGLFEYCPTSNQIFPGKLPWEQK